MCNQTKEQRRIYYLQHRDDYIERARRYYQANREHIISIRSERRQRQLEQQCATILSSFGARRGRGRPRTDDYKLILLLNVVSNID